MIEELETFLAVAEYRNFTRAAQKRNISQPTASVQIKKLEEFFGASLIERTAKHKNVALTSAGKILLQSAGNICAEIEYAKAAIGGRKNLKVCCASAQARRLANTFCRSILAGLLKNTANWSRKL